MQQAPMKHATAEVKRGSQGSRAASAWLRREPPRGALAESDMLGDVVYSAFSAFPKHRARARQTTASPGRRRWGQIRLGRFFLLAGIAASTRV
jgi:hypothetical protein